VGFDSAVNEKMRLFRENAMYRPALMAKTSKLGADLCAWILKELDEVGSRQVVNSPLRPNESSEELTRSSSGVKFVELGDNVAELPLNAERDVADGLLTREPIKDFESVGVSQSDSFMEAEVESAEDEKRDADESIPDETMVSPVSPSPSRGRRESVTGDVMIALDVESAVPTAPRSDDV